MTHADSAVSERSGPNRALVLAAFAAIYLIWGSTYLAIKYAVSTVPPFLMTGVRFLIAGAVLYGWSIRRPRGAAETNRNPRPRGREWRDAFIVGSLLIVAGTALVGWAEQSVPSGITSLVLATNPVWMVLLESMTESRRLPAPMVVGGVVIGLAGLGILVGPSIATGGQGGALGIGALIASALAWSVGAIYSRRVAPGTSPARATGMQMIAGATASIVVALVVGEHRRVSLEAISTQSLLAVVYLIVAGALVGFTAYLWLMRVSTPSRVATHAYVNPAVAVLLGWAVLGEPVTPRTGVAMAVILVGVVLIVSASRWPRSAEWRRVLSFRHGALAQRQS